MPKAKYGGRENADIMQFFNYPSVTYGDSSPDKGSHDLYFIDKLKHRSENCDACINYQLNLMKKVYYQDFPLSEAWALLSF